MKHESLRELRKALFSSTKEEWTSVEAWSGRALAWKLMAIGLMEGGNEWPHLNKLYELFMTADQSRAPNERELVDMCKFFEQFIAEVRQGKTAPPPEKPKSSLILPPHLQ